MKRFLRSTTFLTWAAVAQVTPAAADPVSMALAATASSLVGGAGIVANIAAASFLGLTGLGAVFAQFAVRVALGYALDSLTPKPKSGTVGGGYTSNSLGPALPRAVVYGERRVGGAIFFKDVTGSPSEFLHHVIAFAGHEIDSFDSILLNGAAVTLDGSGDVTSPAQYSGQCRIKEHLGTSTQAADTDLVSESTYWTTAHQAKDVAYLYARFEVDATAYPNGAPPVVTAIVKGRKVYDPRDASTAWSDNPALCLRDYLTTSIGLGEAAGAIDDVSFAIAANICDELVSGERRFRCSGTFTLDEAPEAVLRGLVSSMGGMIWYAGGKWYCKAAAYVTPDLSLDENDFRSDLQVTTKHSRRSNFNTVRGTFTGAENNWQSTDYPQVSVPAYVTEDAGETIETDLALPFTPTSVIAERIATIMLERNRRQITVSAAFGLRALNAAVGDTIQLTNARMGWTDKTFEVVDWRLGTTADLDLQVNMMLREIDSAVFA